MKRILGLDVGSRTVGVAVSDQLGWTAQGVEIIQINEDEKEFGIDRMKELVTKYEPGGFVLGLPKNMNNTSGPRVDASRAYGELLKEIERFFAGDSDGVDEETMMDSMRILDAANRAWLSKNSESVKI